MAIKYLTYKYDRYVMLLFNIVCMVVLASEAVSILKQYGVLEEMGTTLDLVASDILDHYRTYSLLEKLIHYPTKLDQQLAFQIEPQTKDILVEK